MSKFKSVIPMTVVLAASILVSACGPSNGPSLLGNFIDNGSIGGGDGDGGGGTDPDGGGGGTSPTPTPTPVVRKKIFAAYDNTQYGDAARSSGNFGGISGADARCAARKHPSLDPSATVKAFLVDGVDRVACTTANCSGGASEHVDWVLAPDTEYENVAGELIFKTNADGIFVFGTPDHVITPSTTHQYYTGMNANWTSAADNCDRWTNLTGSFNGRWGYTSEANAYMIALGPIACSNYIQYVCVEQ